MQNRVYVIIIYIYIYVWMVRVSLKRARGELVFSKKHCFLGLSPVYSELKLQSVRKFLRKRLLFKKQKVDSTGYYGIEDPFPDFIDCWLSRAIGSQNAVVLMLRKLLLLLQGN